MAFRRRNAASRRPSTSVGARRSCTVAAAVLVVLMSPLASAKKLAATLKDICEYDANYQQESYNNSKCRCVIDAPNSNYFTTECQSINTYQCCPSTGVCHAFWEGSLNHVDSYEMDDQDEDPISTTEYDSYGQASCHFFTASKDHPNMYLDIPSVKICYYHDYRVENDDDGKGTCRISINGQDCAWCSTDEIGCMSDPDGQKVGYDCSNIPGIELVTKDMLRAGVPQGSCYFHRSPTCGGDGEEAIEWRYEPIPEDIDILADAPAGADSLSKLSVSAGSRDEL